MMRQYNLLDDKPLHDRLSSLLRLLQSITNRFQHFKRLWVLLSKYVILSMDSHI